MRPRTLLTTGLLAALGCGQSPAPAPPPAVTAPTAEPAPPPPAAAKVGYEPDPAKHVVPDRPAAGELGGEPFAPTVTLVGRELLFRTGGVNGEPERSVMLTVPAGVTKLVVRPADPAGAGVPELLVQAAGATGTRLYQNGYALTLELGPAGGSTRPGKVYLSIDDTKSFIAGTFAATVERAVGERPTAADGPFIEGAVTRAPGVVGDIRVGYLMAGPGDVADAIVSPVNSPSVSRSDSPAPPRAAGYTRSAGGERYEFTRLPPGRYLVYARPDAGGGPAAWTHVDLPAGGAIDAPLALDPATQGAVTVKVPAGVTDPVTLLPVDPKPGAPVADELLAPMFSYKEPTKDGAATFKAVAPGTYRAVVTGKSATVTVTAGKPATIEVGK